MQINLEPGDRARLLRTGEAGIVQWINWETSEISLNFGNNSYTVCGFEEVEGLVERVLKPVSEMTPEEMKLELELLRESRRIAIRDSRAKTAKRREKAEGERLNISSGKAKIEPDPFSFLSPEQKALLQAKLKEGKEG